MGYLDGHAQLGGKYFIANMNSYQHPHIPDYFSMGLDVSLSVALLLYITYLLSLFLEVCFFKYSQSRIHDLAL